MYFVDGKRLRRLISYCQLGELKVHSVSLVRRRESSKYQAKFTIHHVLWYSVQNMNRYDEHALNQWHVWHCACKNAVNSLQKSQPQACAMNPYVIQVMPTEG